MKHNYSEGALRLMASGVSMSEVADSIGTTRSYIGHAVAGRRPMQASILYAIFELSGQDYELVADIKRMALAGQEHRLPRAYTRQVSA